MVVDTAYILLYSNEIRKHWGDFKTASQKVTAYRLEWLGHLRRMKENCTPHRCLFSHAEPTSRDVPRRIYIVSVHRVIDDIVLIILYEYYNIIIIILSSMVELVSDSS